MKNITNSKLENRAKRLNAKNEIEDYTLKAAEINKKWPNVKAKVNNSSFGGRLEIEVSTVNRAKALNEIYKGFNFTSGMYK